MTERPGSRFPAVCRGESGSALILSLLVLFGLTAIGSLFLVKSSTEKQISGNDKRSTQALFNAEAGYAEAVARLGDPFDATNYVGPPLDDWLTNPGWGTYLVAGSGNSAQDPDVAVTASDGLDNNGNGVADESGEKYPEVTSSAGAGLNYPWVKVRYKRNSGGQVLLFGDHDSDPTTIPVVNLVSGFPVMVIASEGQRGSAVRRVEVEAVKSPFEVPNTAVYSESDDFNFNGTSFLVSGEDHDPVTFAPLPGNPEGPGIMTTGDPDNVTSALNGNQQNNVTGSGTDPSVSLATADYDLQAIRNAYAPSAQTTLNSGTYSNQTWGSYSSYTSVHCTGDLHTSGTCAGGGLLIVDGDLDVSGQFEWVGLVIVLGDIRFTGGGGGIHLVGSVMVQGEFDTQVVSGNADLFYSSQALERLSTFVPYTVASWREL